MAGKASQQPRPGSGPTDARKRPGPPAGGSGSSSSPPRAPAAPPVPVAASSPNAPDKAFPWNSEKQLLNPPGDPVAMAFGVNLHGGGAGGSSPARAQQPRASAIVALHENKDPLSAVFRYDGKPLTEGMLKDEKDVAKRFNILKFVKTHDGQSFISLLGAEAQQALSYDFDALNRVNLGFRMYGASNLCPFSKGADDRLNFLDDGITSRHEPFSDQDPALMVFKNTSIQRLVQERPELFKNSAIQAAAESSSFGYEMGGINQKIEDKKGTFRGYLRRDKPGAQAEAVGLMLLAESVFRKYITEPLFAKNYPLWFGDGIDLFKNQSLENMLIGYAQESQMVIGRGASGKLIPIQSNLRVGHATSFAINFSRSSDSNLREKARVTLAVQMLGAIKAAYLDGKKTIFLTGLGLGRFNNQPEWFVDAMGPVLDFAKAKNMHVGLVLYDSDNNGNLKSARDGVIDKAKEKKISTWVAGADNKLNQIS